MTSKYEFVEIRLPDGTVRGLYEIAKLAGVKPETVIKVLLAISLRQEPSK